jgi:hypothetical protein
MNTIQVTCQKEWDALKDFEEFTVIEIRSKEFLVIKKTL